MTVEKAARAGVWSAADIVLRQGLQFGVSVILARLLSPEDFGLMTLLAFFSSLSIIFVQGGLSTALVRQPNTTREEESAVFWCNLFASGVFALLLIAIAPAVARFYGLPLLQPLMFVAAAQVVLSALGAVHTALLSRSLRFDKLAFTGLLSSLISGVMGVAAALAGYGVWSLAVQLIAMAVIGSASLWWVSDWRPQLRFRLSSLRALFGFGAYLSISSALETIYGNLFVLILGKFYGPRDVGYFSRAHGVQSLPTGIITAIVGRTVLPLFAERMADADATRRGFKLSLSFMMLLTLPIMVGLSLVSDLVILTLFGAKWMPAAPVLAIAAWGGALTPLHVLNLNLLLARGGSKRFLKLELQKKLIGVVIVGVGCFYGIIGVAYAEIGAEAEQRAKRG